MKITALRLREVTGQLEHPEPFWEDWLVRPLDVYTDRRAAGDEGLSPLGEGRYALSSIFLEIHTDGDLAGLAGPIPQDQAFVIDRQLKGLLIGSDGDER